MAVFLISYDLHNDRNYDALYEAFDEQNVGRILESTWLGELHASTREVREWVQSLLDEDDTILVIKMKPKHGWAGTQLVEGASSWIRSLLNPS
ncbi:hypothetical protein [Hirschia baltica]|uniref:CRISPR-associated endoribonuclease Cas2 n=1 Tax=Hirschia baltica (strain ATCC 49814 / DSM 5838 / IFAM 1418) TaxID=582402 RepID=C6XM88_HIRBI|nr:hypothetical protein [Hirschia baltica]ACT58031.1 putative SinR-like protein [Hirschia baltica ATCC 49814]